MLNDAIGDLLPPAIAVALSPIPIVGVVVVLGAERARTAGPAFALGWIAGLLAVSVIVVLLLGSGSDPRRRRPGRRLARAGHRVLFVLMAAKQWTKRPKPGEEPETPGWMTTIDSAAPARAAVLGAALSGANPSASVLHESPEWARSLPPVLRPGAHPDPGAAHTQSGSTMRKSPRLALTSISASPRRTTIS